MRFKTVLAVIGTLALAWGDPGQVVAQELNYQVLSAESPALEISWVTVPLTPADRTSIYARCELQRSVDLVHWETILNTVDGPREVAGLRYALTVDLDSTHTFYRLAKFTELTGADLDGVDFRGVDFRGIDFSQASLVGARLSHADFTGANLTGVNLQGADLEGAVLTDVEFFDASIDDETVIDDAVRALIMGVGYETNIVINEVRSTGDDEIELFNSGDLDVDVSGWQIIDERAENSPYIFPEETVIDAGAYLVLKKGTHHEFGLGGADRVTLFSATKTIDEVAWASGAALASYGRIPNGTGLFRPNSESTLGAENMDNDTSTIIEPLWIVGGVQGSGFGEQFDEPNELTFDSRGNLWAGDVNNLRVQVFDSEGNFLRIIGGEGEELGRFVNPALGKKGPEAIAEDSQGQIYVVDRGGDKINVYDGATFEALREIRSELFVDPTGLAIDTQDQLYVADQGTDQIHQFDRMGTYVRTFQQFQSDNVTPVLLKTETLGLDEARDWLFASSEDASRIEIFQLSTGEWTGRHVSELQSGDQAEPGRVVDDVEGLAVDTINALLFVSDEDNGRVLVHDISAGDLLSDPQANYAFRGAFGRLGSAAGELLSADGIAVMPEKNRLAIADQGNFRIQVFDLTEILNAL